MTAAMSSIEITPSATWMGRYEEASGTTAAARPREVNGSRIAVTTWTPTKATDRSARLRWRPTVRNRGQPGVCARETARSPRQATALKRISETAPEPRVANHRIWVDMRDELWRSNQGRFLRRRSKDGPGHLSMRLRRRGPFQIRARPAIDPDDPAVDVDEAGRETGPLEPREPVRTEDDRRGRGRVRLHTRGRGDGRRPP